MMSKFITDNIEISSVGFEKEDYDEEIPGEENYDEKNSNEEN